MFFGNLMCLEAHHLQRSAFLIPRAYSVPGLCVALLWRQFHGVKEGPIVQNPLYQCFLAIMCL